MPKNSLGAATLHKFYKHFTAFCYRFCAQHRYNKKRYDAGVWHWGRGPREK